MELLVLNSNYIVDVFESSLWVDRYCGYGDFEIYTKISKEILENIRKGYYILSRDSEHGMIVEDRKIKFDTEIGHYIIVTGRSFESILDRRIIWNQTVLTGNLQNGIEKLLNENIISPDIPERAIPNFVFIPSDDPVITSLEVEAQFTRTNLYDSIKKLCLANDLGFKITLSENDGFEFRLYSGRDRSYNQFINPYVTFSPKFENLISSEYSESYRNTKTITVVAGEGEGLDRKTIVVGGGEGLLRKEMYTDARDLSQTVDEVTLTDEEYFAQLSQRGMEDLKEHMLDESFDGEIDPTQTFKFNEDFFLGDIVQIDSEYGIEARARITESIHAQDESGESIYPTFTIID